MGNSTSWQVLERHYGAARLKHYLAEALGDRVLAAALYSWNAEISAALWESLGHLEVALRNTIDRQMTARHRRLGRTSHWIFDDAQELGRATAPGGKHRYPYVDVEQARQRVRRNKKPMSADQVLSELSFGFWHQMVSRHQMALWPDLASGFPNAPTRSQSQVHDIVRDLRELRNRIGHHHRIWNVGIAHRHDQLLDLAGYMSADLEPWIADHSRVSSVLAERPC